MSVPATASQTVGPYFSIGLAYRNSTSLCAESAAGEHIEVSGQVFDGAGHPVPDAQLELWQADSEGHYAGFDPDSAVESSKDFIGFARVPTDAQGGFQFHSIRPGSVIAPDGTVQAPHIVVLLSMRGLLKHLFTRIYFANDSLNSADPVLSAVPEARRQTLLAQPKDGQPQQYRWDIRLQGDDETVFFAY
jgi:protocatechuate 3,4-dioxygenase, alpha subunit